LWEVIAIFALDYREVVEAGVGGGWGGDAALLIFRDDYSISVSPSRRMLERYGPVRMDAKRTAMDTPC
jgi:hypothetical protein